MLAVCLLAGAVAGLLAGLFGIGGGLVLVPFLLMLFRAQGFAEQLLMIMAIATSLATINITALASIRAHQRLGNIVWSAVRGLAPGVLFGGMLGAMVADRMPAETLRLFFAVFLVYVALQMARPIKTCGVRRGTVMPLLALAGTLIGAVSAIVGIGGGTLTVPLLARLDYPMRNAVAVSSACGLPIALSGTCSYILLGWHKSGLPAGSFGYIYLPAFIGIVAGSVLFAPFGARLAHRLPAAKLKRYFAALLLVVAVKVLLV